MEGVRGSGTISGTGGLPAPWKEVPLWELMEEGRGRPRVPGLASLGAAHGQHGALGQDQRVLCVLPAQALPSSGLEPPPCVSGPSQGGQEPCSDP